MWQIPEAAEVEFRDGVRAVPPHIAALLADVETWKYTYDEAIELTNEKLLRDRLNGFQQKFVHRHFVENR